MSDDQRATRRTRPDHERLSVREIRQAINRHVTLKADRDGLAYELLTDDEEAPFWSAIAEYEAAIRQLRSDVGIQGYQEDFELWEALDE